VDAYLSAAERDSEPLDSGPVGRRVALGVYAPGLFRRPARIGRYARLLGRSPLIVSEYKQWDFAPFVRDELADVWRRGALPMITWEPLSYHGHRYPLRRIVRGGYDRYLRNAARAAAAWGKPILLRFAHEMNGDWYPWGRGVDGNTARLYKHAWRHAVRIFRRLGAGNVRWLWCPNVNQAGGLPFAGLYPGGRWVDWVGLDGFNWGYGGRSYSFRSIFASSLSRLARIAPGKPAIVAETGAYDRGKARWIRQALGRQLPRLGRVRAMVWFNQPVNGVDLRFDGTRAGLRAMRHGTRRELFDVTREWLLGAG